MKQSTKNVLLVTGFFLVLLSAYQFSFSRTFTVKNDLENLKIQVERSSGSYQNMAVLEKKEQNLDSLISENRRDSTSPQNRLLQSLNNYSHELSIKIISFKEPHLSTSPDYQNKVTSFQFLLEGEYIALEQLLFLLETEHNFGSLSHLSFKRRKDYRLNTNFLQCIVVLQYIE